VKRGGVTEIKVWLVIFYVVLGIGGGGGAEKMFPNTFYLGFFRRPDATLKRWQALQL